MRVQIPLGALMNNLAEDILSEFVERAARPEGMHPAAFGLRVALPSSHGWNDGLRLAKQRAYERTKWATDPDYRARKNEHRRNMRKGIPAYGR